jgi:hypothetical protein
MDASKNVTTPSTTSTKTSSPQPGEVENHNTTLISTISSKKISSSQLETGTDTPSTSMLENSHALHRWTAPNPISIMLLVIHLVLCLVFPLRQTMVPITSPTTAKHCMIPEIPPEHIVHDKTHFDICASAGSPPNAFGPLTIQGMDGYKRPLSHSLQLGEQIQLENTPDGAYDTTCVFRDRVAAVKHSPDGAYDTTDRVAAVKYSDTKEAFAPITTTTTAAEIFPTGNDGALTTQVTTGSIHHALGSMTLSGMDGAERPLSRALDHLSPHDADTINRVLAMEQRFQITSASDGSFGSSRVSNDHGETAEHEQLLDHGALGPPKGYDDHGETAEDAPHARNTPHRNAPQRTAPQTQRNAPHRSARSQRNAPHRDATHRNATHRTATQRGATDTTLKVWSTPSASPRTTASRHLRR